jgi:hypothetical protein
MGLALAMASQSATAQVPTAQQLEILRSMSPEDRDALLEQLGLGGSAIDEGDQSKDGGRESRRREGDDEFDQEDLLRERQALDKSLKPEDTVLITIDFKKDVPPRIEPQGEASNAGTSLASRSRSGTVGRTLALSRSQQTLRACCATQLPVGCAVHPALKPRPLRRCKFNSVRSVSRRTVSTVKKSHASSPAAWARRNAGQASPARRGAGGTWPRRRTD